MTKGGCRATVEMQPVLELSVGAESKLTKEVCKPEKCMCLW